MGYNCAQSVLASFAKDFGISDDSAKRISSCFGGGMRMGATCGALSGALMVLGLAEGFDTNNPKQKKRVEELSIILTKKWKALLGSSDCRDIIGVDVTDPIARQQARDQGIFDRLCPICITTGVELAEELLLFAKGFELPVAD